MQFSEWSNITRWNSSMKCMGVLKEWVGVVLGADVYTFRLCFNLKKSSYK